jgi:hypothetical protein
VFNTGCADLRTSYVTNVIGVPRDFEHCSKALAITRHCKCNGISAFGSEKRSFEETLPVEKVFSH